MGAFAAPPLEWDRAAPHRTTRTICLISALVAAVLSPPVSTAQDAAATTSAAGGSSGLMRTIAGSTGAGPALSVAQAPSDVALFGKDLFVADALYGAVRRVDLTSGVETTVLQASGPTGPADAGGADGVGRAAVGFRQGLAVDASGALYVSQRDKNQVVKLTASGATNVVAGAGAAGYSGDGAPAVGSALNGPVGVAIDAQGDLFIADSFNNAVRKVSPSGTITTFAGTGVAGFSGDGGPATSAQLRVPVGVAVDSAGDVLIAEGDFAGHIRKVSPDGTITTLVGSGTRPCDFATTASQIAIGDPQAVTVAPDGTVTFVACQTVLHLASNGQISVVGPSTSSPPPNSRFHQPLGVVVDVNGATYVADPAGGVVRRIGMDNTDRTVAGRWAVVSNLRVGLFDSGDEAPAVSAQLAYPTGLAVAPTGAVVMSDGLNESLRIISADGVISTAVGNPSRCLGRPGAGSGPFPTSSVSLCEPSGITIGPDGAFYLAQMWLGTILRLAADGTTRIVAGGNLGACQPNSGDGGPATSASLLYPDAVAFDPSGALVIVERFSGRLRRVAADGTITTIIGSAAVSCNGTTGDSTPFLQPTGLAISSDGTMWITDTSCLWKLASGAQPTCIAKLTAPSPEVLKRLWATTGGLPAGSRSDVVVDPAGGVFYSDPFGHVVNHANPDATIVTVAGTGSQGCGDLPGPATSSALDLPTRLATGPGGALVIADMGCHRLRQVGGLAAPSPVTRLSGLDRLSTAAEISRAAFPNGAAGSVVLARSDTFADALAGTPLAVAKNGPLLLTTPDHLDAWAESELTRVLPAGGTVFILGGPAALQPSVETRVRTLGYQSVRLAGSDRYETGVTIATVGLGNPANVLLTTGTDFPDALSAAAAAANNTASVLLTDGSSMPAATRRALIGHDGHVTTIGGPAAAAEPKAPSIVGADRYATAAAVAAHFFPTPTSIAFATGTAFPDALSGGAAIGQLRGPLLLTNPDHPADAVRNYLQAIPKPGRGYIYGGPAAVTTSTGYELAGLI